MATKLEFGTQPSNTLAGGVITPAVTVRITDASGTLVTTDTRDVTVAIGTNPAAGTLGGTQTVAAVGGVATFSTLTIDNPGTGYTFVASASGLTGATSVPFNITTTPPPSANLVVNGGFESGTNPWKFYQNGTGNSFSVVTTAPVPEGAYKARIVLGSTIGTNNQLYQNDLTLEANTAYRITFDYHASGSTNFRVRVIEQNDDYTVYGFAFRYVYPTTSVQTYTLDFTTANFAGTVNDAMLQFYFVGGTASRTIYLDNIVIRKQAPAPPLVATKLEFGTQPSNTLAGGVITPAVTVRITDASGNLVTTDTRDVTVAIGTNPAAGTLGGTQTVAAVGGVATFSTLSINNLGTGYTLWPLPRASPERPRRRSTSPVRRRRRRTSWLTEGSKVGRSRGSTTRTVGQCLQRGDHGPGSEGDVQGQDRAGSTIGTNNQLYQNDLTLEANTAYRITFDHHASGSTSFRVRVIEQNDDYTVYGFAFRYVYPTTSVQTYTLDFTTANFAGTVNDAMLQFYFVGGTASRTIYLDDIVIAKMGALAKEGEEAVPAEMPTEFS